MSTSLNEFDVLKRNLPLQKHLHKYLCVKTKINTFDDYEFRLELGLDKTVRKFSHTGWTEMKPLVVGIKCYIRDGKAASVFVRHCDRKKEKIPVVYHISYNHYGEECLSESFRLDEI